MRFALREFAEKEGARLSKEVGLTAGKAATPEAEKMFLIK